MASQTSWQGCATYLSTRIWGGYSGGPCPNVGLNGTGINYSYGDVTLSQAIAVNQALANAGSNIQVNGYNYSWQVKNSNINNTQPGGYDPIATITVNLNDKSNHTLVSDTYNYGYRLANWTTFSGTRTYDNPYAMDTLSTISLSVRSKDSGYWAGYYGPEFQNFNLSLKYSVVAPPPPPPTPSVTPTVPTSTTTSVPVTTKTVAATTSSSDPTSSPVTSVNVGGVELSSSGTISAPDGVPQTVKDVVATTTPASTTTTTTTTDSSSSSSTVASTTKTETKAGAPMSLIMSTISKIQENDKATQKAAVQNAAQQVSMSTSKSQDQAASVVSSLNAMSMASSQESTQSTSSQQQSTQQVVGMLGPQTLQNNGNQGNNAQTTVSVGSTSFSLPTQGRTVQTYTAPSTQSTSVSYSLFTPPVSQPVQQTYTPVVVATVDVPVMQTSLIGSRTNPLAEMMEAKNFFSINQVEQKQDTVNRNVQMNELAAGVDITAIASTPKGYDAYTTLTLVDARFYKPEEIYKNQITTDNVRVLRGLTGGSDRLHQEMVNQQFKLGR